MSVFLVRRELALAWAEGGSSLRAILFFIVVLGITPLAVSPAPDTLMRLGGGLIWIVALLANLLSLDRLFQTDLEDGSLAILLTTARHDAAHQDVGPWTIWQVAGAKCVAHWLFTGLPIAITAPFISLWYALPVEALGYILLSLLIGTLCLTAIGTIGAALFASIRRGGVLITIVIMPLYIPVLIFGTAVVEAVITHANPWPMIQILCGLSLVAVALGPWVAAAALKVHLD